MKKIVIFSLLFLMACASSNLNKEELKTQIEDNQKQVIEVLISHLNKKVILKCKKMVAEIDSLIENSIEGDSHSTIPLTPRINGSSLTNFDSIEGIVENGEIESEFTLVCEPI